VHKILRIAGRICLGLLALAALFYAGDDLWARFRGKPVEHIKVGLYYAVENRWNEIEYSVGKPVIQTCVDALLPHFGHQPCWYLKKHPIQQVGP